MVVANVFGVPDRAGELVVERVAGVVGVPGRAGELVVERVTGVVGVPERPDGLPPQAARTTATARVATPHAPTWARRPVRAPVVLSLPAAA